ncbi:MAG: inner membrane protein [Parcubacteria group bacterium Gr01-1014_70]|nr:MAG: inner membrane protein [Parcubacteria group bacterium Gr01-1014_70]
MVVLYVSIFLLSSIMLAVAGDWLVRSLSRIARFFGWNDFIAAFFIMSVAVSVPELFIGITAALEGIPELSFGNIIGANIIHFTLAIALATIVLGKLTFESSNVRLSVDFTILFALLPFLLMIDGMLSQRDGIILMSAFLIYVIWVFSKREHFSKQYQPTLYNGHVALLPFEAFRQFIKDFGTFLFGAGVLLLAAKGIVEAASFFALTFHIPLVVVGVFIVGLGTALPETYFAVASARRGNQWMVVGNLLGSTVLTASLVLGLVAFLHPIVINDFSPYVIARAFLILSGSALLVFSRTGNTLTTREAFILLTFFVVFGTVQILFR